MPLAAVWLVVKRQPIRHLMATGGDDRAAFTAGVPVATVGSSPTSSPAYLPPWADRPDRPDRLGRRQRRGNYTLLAISAVALGGVSLAGGSGGPAAAILGGLAIFLLQAALTFFNVSTFLLQIAYGLVLTMAVVLNSARWRRREAVA
jgi:ribose transport system permease protein